MPSDTKVFIKAYIEGKFSGIKTKSETDGTFTLDRLMSGKTYTLQFKATRNSLTQKKEWAGFDNIGVTSSSDAKGYSTNTYVPFKFSTVVE